jgi:hypothetical protein
MTEIKLTLDAPAAWVASLRALHDRIGAASSPASQLADQIERAIPAPAIEEPTELWSVIFANVPGSKMLEPKQLVKMDGWWSDSEGNGWGDFSGFSDVEVLRIGVGEAQPFTEEEIDQQQAEAIRILHKLNTVAAGEITPPDPDETRFYEAQSSDFDRANMADESARLDEANALEDARAEGYKDGFRAGLTAGTEETIRHDAPSSPSFCRISQGCRLADGHKDGCKR